MKYSDAEKAAEDLTSSGWFDEQRHQIEIALQKAYVSGYEAAFSGAVAGSPLEPGDRITIDEHGRAHAVPRRHRWGVGADWCIVCGQVSTSPEEDRPCPGPRT